MVGPDGVLNELERMGVTGVCGLRELRGGNSENDGGGVIGAAGKAWDGVMVWGAMELAGGSQGRILFMDTECDIRSGWLKIGLDKQGLVADSGR